jgi:hypothetical protein
VVAERGGVVVGVVSYAVSGFDPFWLVEAAELARQHAAIILAETTDRLVRNHEYHSKENPEAQATEPELESLRRCTLGVVLMTHLHPDASPRQARSYHRRRGQREKGHAGGRPHKQDRAPGHRNRRNARCRPLVLKWHRQEPELSSRELETRLAEMGEDVSHATVAAWINAAKGRL